MVFFLSKLRLIVTFLKSDSISIDQFSAVIIFKDGFDYLVTLWAEGFVYGRRDELSMLMMIPVIH